MTKACHQSQRVKVNKILISAATNIMAPFWVHPCLDYPLMDYSRLDYLWLDYKDSWTTPNWTTYDVWTTAVWTTKTFGLLVHVDYQNLDYIPNRLHCHLDYIRLDYFGLRNVYSYKKAEKDLGSSKSVHNGPKMAWKDLGGSKWINKLA